MKCHLSLIIIFSLFLCQAASAQFLVEIFSNTDCTNCKTPETQHGALLAQHPEYQIKIIFINNNFPSSADPFNMAPKADVNARLGNNFYQVGINPTAFISSNNGCKSFSMWKSFADQTASTVKYSATLSISTYMNGSGKVIADLHADGAYAGMQKIAFAP